VSVISVQAIDSSGELIWGSDQQNMLYDLDAVRQIIQTTLNLWMGEWWEDRSIGLAMWQSIMDQRAGERARQAMSQLIQAQILSVPYVTGISNVQMVYQNRALMFACTVETSFGSIPLVLYPTPPLQTTPNVQLYNEGPYL
jgi:hypothetical protein